MTITFDSYPTYDRLTTMLRELAAAHPQLLSLGSIGTSYEDRQVWVMTVTDTSTGAHSDKPAMYVDGNTHAGEVTGSMVCLYLIDHLVNNAGDPFIAHLLATRTFYIVPRVNPDGAEKFLTTPYTLRSGTRLYPDDSVADTPGLHQEDINGDGRILTMRYRDDLRGEWKVSRRDPRLMLPRRPDDREGPFYRLLPEGYVKEYEGEPVAVAPSRWGLDFNRNFPSHWSPALRGGGPYPTSEREIKNIVDFILTHPNIGGLHAYHTSGGIIFRSPYVYPEEKMDSGDFRTMIELVRLGTEVTGYPDVASFGGEYAATIVDWAYEHRGIIGFTPELWDLYGRAGVKRGERGRRPPTPEELEETGIQLLTWNDRELAGRGFVAWSPFSHPQLGAVEIGGWDIKYCRYNPPPHLLLGECHKNARFTLRHAAALPEVRILRLEARSLGGGVYLVEAELVNVGYLGTAVCNQAMKTKAATPVRAEVILPAGCELVRGQAVTEVGHLDGFGGASPYRPAASTARLSWVVRTAQPRAQLTVAVRGGRGGNTRAAVDLACG